MKNISKILTISAISLLGFHSCTSGEDFEGLNDDPKHSAELPSKNLLASSLLQTSTSMYTPSVNYNNYRFFVQHTTEKEYTDEANYDLKKRNQPRKTFNDLYAKGLNQLKLAKEAVLVESNSLVKKENKLATIEIQEIFVWETLVDTYGDVPYSEALNDDISSPKYDDAFTIYKDLIIRLDAVVAKIDESESGYGDEDLIYNGDMSKWRKFANSIKLRLGMNLADVDAVLSKNIVESAVVSGVISNDQESYSLIYDGATFSSPVYEQFIGSGRDDFMPAEGIINFMNTNKDPRLDVWFTKPKGSFKGGVVGNQNKGTDISRYKDILTNAQAPVKLLSYTEVAFLLTEAAARGYSVGGTAVDLYNDAVTISMSEYGVNTVAITDYLTINPYVAANWKKNIGEQAWVALFDRAFAAWNFSRRLDLDTESNVLVEPTANELTTKVPFRMPFSDKEYELNGTNVELAAIAIGGDRAETKLFWDVN